MLDYQRPDENPGRKQYSVFAKSLESPQKAPDQMRVEEFVQAAEFKLKETNPSAMQELVAKALQKDPGYSRAHLLLGIYDYTGGKYKDAEAELLKQQTVILTQTRRGITWRPVSSPAGEDGKGRAQSLCYLSAERLLR